MQKNNLIYSLDAKKIYYYFWIFIALHIVIWTLIPTLLRPSVHHDTLEGITWGLQWQLGYAKHPFLAAWLCAGISQLFQTTGWPVYFLAQLAVFFTFFAVWKLAKQLFPPIYALLAVFILEGIPFYNINSFNVTPDTLQSPLWALLSLFFYQALLKQNVKNWLGVGLFAALSVCTKYQAIILLLPMLFFCLINPFARKSFTKSGIYIALIVFGLLITPHIIWLYHHDFITLSYATDTLSDYSQKTIGLAYLFNPLHFIVNNSIAVIGLLLLLIPFYKAKKIDLPINAFQWQFLICVGLGPIILSFILCLITDSHFPARWSTPYFFTFSIIMLAYIKPSLDKKNIFFFTSGFILFNLLLISAKISSLIFFPRVDSDSFLPNKKIALFVTQLWQKRYPTSLPYLAGSHYLVTSVLPYMSRQPSPYLDWSLENSPWIDEENVRKKGGIFIWDLAGNYTWDQQSALYNKIPNSVLRRFPNLIQEPDQVFYTTLKNKPIVIGIAILYPKL